MSRLATAIGTVAAVGACTALLAGGALAGNPHDPAPPGAATPPGQAKKGTDAKAGGGLAQSHATGKAEAKGKTKAHGKSATRGHGQARVSRPSTLAHPSVRAFGQPQHPTHVSQASAQSSHRPAFAQSKGRGHASTAQHKVLICHRTGSATNPYVVINISINAWLNGHMRHPALDGRADILLKDPAAPGEKADPALVAELCGTAAAAQAGSQQPLAPRQPLAPQHAAAPQSPSAAAAAAGGVKGVSATRSPARARGAGAGGVLGAFASVTRPVARGQLPFTGLPLWLAAALGGAALAAGLGLRRSGRPT